MSFVQLRGISRVYHTGEVDVHALRAIDLEFEQGHFVAVMGASGSGKSTLLNVLGMLDQPSSGDYILDGENVAELNDNERSEIRCRKVGIVFQSFNLFPQFSVIENVCVPMRYAGADKKEMRGRAVELLHMLGLGDRLKHNPNQLSGGQCQRVAIARALANDPVFLLADEPTGNLDEKTGKDVIDVFRKLATDGRTVIMVTHNPEYESEVERVIELHDGRVSRS